MSGRAVVPALLQASNIETPFPPPATPRPDGVAFSWPFSPDHA